MPQIPFALESYASRSPPVSQQRLINMYAEVQPEEVSAKSQAVLFGAAGLVSLVTVGAGPIRAMHYFNGLLYVVSGTSLYSVTSAYVVTLIGSGMKIGTNPVSIADNGNEIMIVDGTNGFTYNTTTLAYAQIADVDFYAANIVTYIDSYMMLDRKNTNQFFSSDSADATAYDPLFFASAESQSDYVLAPINHLQQLLIAGERSIEIWYLAGGSNFPWARYQGAAVQVGIAGAFAWTKLKAHLYIVGSDRVFYRLDGATPTRASKHAIEYAWRTYGDISDCFCFGLTWEGHDFIYVTFPTANKTWCFDATTGLWHERESWNSSNESLGRWRANTYAFAFNKHLIGDYDNGTIGELSSTTYTEYGNTIRGLATTPPIHKDGLRVFMGRLEVDVESGVGLTTGQGSNPQAILRISDDGGRTWVESKWRSLGAIGAYRQRLRWLGMGSFYERMLELSITDPVRRTVISSFMDVEADG